jgi:HEAT repeat protein
MIAAVALLAIMWVDPAQVSSEPSSHASLTVLPRLAPSVAIAELQSPDSAVRLRAATALAEAGASDVGDVAALVRQLDSAKPWVRYWSCVALGRIVPVDKSVTSKLKILLADNVPEVRQRAAKAIYAIDPQNNRCLRWWFPVEWLPLIGKKELVPAMLREVIVDRAAVTDDISDTFGRHSAALHVLGSLGPEAHAAVPTLIEAVDNWSSFDPSPILECLSQIGRPAVAPLIEHVRRAKYETWECSTLGGMGATVLPDLANLWRDPDSHVRNAVVGAVSFMQPPPVEVVPMLTEALKDPDAEVRYHAAACFSHFDPAKEALIPPLRAAVPILSALLSDSNESVRHITAYSLERLGTLAKDAVPTLIEVLKKDHGRVRFEVAKALGSVGPDASTAVTALLEAFPKSDNETRAAILKSVAQIDKETRLDPKLLDQSIKSPNGPLRIQAALWVNQRDPANEEAREILLARLESPDHNLPQDGMRDLPFFPKEMARTLVQRLRTKTPKSHRIIMSELMKLGPEAADEIPDLMWLLQHGVGENLEDSVINVLVAIGPKSLPALTELACDENPFMRLNAALALAQLGKRPLATELLTEAAGHERRDVRDQAAFLLTGLAEKDSIAMDVLVALLDNPNPKVRATAGRALSRLEHSARRKVIIALTKALRDSDADVRFETIEWLPDVNSLDSNVLPLLAIALRDPDARIRAHVLEGLRWRSSAQDVIILAPLVNELKQDPDSSVANLAGALHWHGVPKSMLFQSSPGPQK